MVDTKKLKARIGVLEVLHKIGARTKFAEAWDHDVQVWCPFCPDAQSHKPAGRATPLNGLYFCYSCGFGGDVITLAQQYLTANKTANEDDLFGSMAPAFDDAVAWLEERWPAEEKDDEDPWSS